MSFLRNFRTSQSWSCSPLQYHGQRDNMKSLNLILEKNYWLYKQYLMYNKQKIKFVYVYSLFARKIKWLFQRKKRNLTCISIFLSSYILNIDTYWVSIFGNTMYQQKTNLAWPLNKISCFLFLTHLTNFWKKNIYNKIEVFLHHVCDGSNSYILRRKKCNMKEILRKKFQFS